MAEAAARDGQGNPSLILVDPSVSTDESGNHIRQGHVLTTELSGSTYHALVVSDLGGGGGGGGGTQVSVVGGEATVTAAVTNTVTASVGTIPPVNVATIGSLPTASVNVATIGSLPTQAVSVGTIGALSVGTIPPVNVNTIGSLPTASVNVATIGTLPGVQVTNTVTANVGTLPAVSVGTMPTVAVNVNTIGSLPTASVNVATIATLPQVNVSNTVVVSKATNAWTPSTFSTTASGTHEVKAGSAGSRIRLYGFDMLNGGDNSVGVSLFNDNTRFWAGTLAATGGIVRTYPEGGYGLDDGTDGDFNVSIGATGALAINFDFGTETV